MHHDLRHLRHALALAEHGHFARAAEACHISQPALTRSILSLEASIGVTLFDRGRGVVEPTGLGQLLLQHAVGLDIASRELEREVDVVVSELSDLAEQDDFESLPLSVHQLFIVCRTGHPLTALSNPTVDDVFRFPLAGPTLPGAAYELLCKLAPLPLRAKMRKEGALTVQCDSSAVLKTIIMDSDAISMMSPFMLSRELADGHLVVLQDLDLGIQARFGAAWISGRTVSNANSAFMELLRIHDQSLHSLVRRGGAGKRPRQTSKTHLGV